MRRPVSVIACAICLGGLFGAAGRAEERQSILLTKGTGAESPPFPNTGPYRAMKDLRIEFRLHDYAVPSEWYDWVARLPGFGIDFPEGPGATPGDR